MPKHRSNALAHRLGAVHHAVGEKILSLADIEAEEPRGFALGAQAAVMPGLEPRHRLQSVRRRLIDRVGDLDFVRLLGRRLARDIKARLALDQDAELRAELIELLAAEGRIPAVFRADFLDKDDTQ